ncbi:MAG TPA: endolytic transglycosylase MltG [Pseudonocardiaceae bacterium]|nr:endolytic transglycosylase MltG [Pseudonocardiaceae bacterium]
MTDGLDLFDNVSENDHGSRRRPSRGRQAPVRRRKRRGLKWTIVLVLVLVIAGGAYFGIRQFAGFGIYPDYSGSGDKSVVFQVNSGDTATDIGNNMLRAGVVKSTAAFVKVAKGSDQVGNVQPGFYVLREHMSASAALAALVDRHSRVGLLEIKSGWQLDDTTSTAGKVTPGILSRIATASCATLNGTKACLTVAGLRAAIAGTDPAALGMPVWAIPSAKGADQKHRFEGMIMPGVYNLKPGETATQTLKRIMDQSSIALQAAGLPSANQQSTGFSPYQILTLASIVERESGTTADMPKIARVFFNRLQQGMDLQSDATVDYALDRPMVATAPADRPGAGAYDTYNISGLPPTPVSSPSSAAIQAATQPAAGTWLFFVVCQKNGSSCFATNLADHNKNVQLAHNNGVF